jgi:hypothetical protein
LENLVVVAVVESLDFAFEFTLSAPLLSGALSLLSPPEENDDEEEEDEDGVDIADRE